MNIYLLVLYLQSMAWIRNENTQLQNCLRCDKIIRPGVLTGATRENTLKFHNFHFLCLTVPFAAV
jgi:hypothetical protein